MLQMSSHADERMVTVAVVGIGGWGKNLARNYYQIQHCKLRYICDLDQRKQHLEASNQSLQAALHASDVTVSEVRQQVSRYQAQIESP